MASCDKENRLPHGGYSVGAFKTKQAKPKVKNSNGNSSSFGTVLRDVKTSASRKLTTVFTAIDNISERIYRTARKQYIQTEKEYDQLDDSSNKTPVKLYSPFSIVTPSPTKEFVSEGRRQRFVSKGIDFSSPTGKLKTDVREMSDGLDDLHAVATALQGRAN